MSRQAQRRSTLAVILLVAIVACDTPDSAPVPSAPLAASRDNAMHGYVRYSQGRFATFDAPDAGTGAFQGTRPSTINDFGMVVGWYVAANNVSHGFLWTSDKEGFGGARKQP